MLLGRHDPINIMFVTTFSKYIPHSIVCMRCIDIWPITLMLVNKKMEMSVQVSDDGFTSLQVSLLGDNLLLPFS